MTDFEDRIFQIEEEIQKTPKHKGTEHHLGRLKAKLAKLKNRLENARKSAGGKGFSIKKQGDATVILFGFPSAGKSTLINQLTRACSKVAGYAFTTIRPIPGMFQYQGALIQIMDLPGIIGGAAKDKGKGRQILAAARVADLLVVVIDSQKLNQEKIIKKELIEARISEIPILWTINKIDLVKEKKKLQYQFSDHFLISAKNRLGLAELKKEIWKKLKLIRVYLRPKGGQPDLTKPLILKKGATVLQAAEKISQELTANLKEAKVSGPKALFPNQPVSLNYQLHDQQILTFIV